MTSGQPQFESRTGNKRLIDDDNFHVPETDAWWEHETVWFWWFHPERKLGCWIYHYLRPNIGVAGGGVFVFDDTAWFHMETPYLVLLEYGAAAAAGPARLHIPGRVAHRDAPAPPEVPAHLLGSHRTSPSSARAPAAF